MHPTKEINKTGEGEIYTIGFHFVSRQEFTYTAHLGVAGWSNLNIVNAHPVLPKPRHGPLWFRVYGILIIGKVAIVNGEL
jgi:hypothetical protein